MKTKISIILLFISLALLIIYGVDVIVSQDASHNGKSGFLQLSEAVRGGVFGGGAVILSIIAFAISLREKSNLVVLLLLVNGGIIIAGMIGLVTKEGSTGSSTIYGTIGLGILIMALGVVKIFITRKR
ncbi:MAG TPA: hypothetical protein VH481_02150 [Nitrososphaeraceae archaeon]|jgi:cell division protein FtsW (lipid II flippase)